MAGLKEIKRRLKSVKNTKKITYAMKLVSAAKLRRSQEAVSNAREYTDELNSLLRRLVIEKGYASFVHPLMLSRPEVRNICVLVVGGQRGLCGGYNSNLHKRIELLLRQQNETHAQLNFHSILLGKKPAEYYRRTRRSYERAYEDLPENPNSWPIEEISRELQHGFQEAAYDEVWMVYTRFKSTISQSAVAERILPLEDISMRLEDKEAPQTSLPSPGMTIFEPSLSEVFMAIVPRILSSRIRQACLEAKASETASRMTAMDSATKNAGQLEKKFQLLHNRLRQLGITSQLLDIVGGAEALK